MPEGPLSRNVQIGRRIDGSRDIGHPVVWMLKCPIILASQSPRRAELLRTAGVAFEAVSPRCEEPDPAVWPGPPVAYAELAARLKAQSVGQDYPERVILAADTIVVLDGSIIGKPADQADARRILTRLSGTAHRVITGVTVLQPAAGREAIRHAVTLVRMRALSEAELHAYLAGGQWAGKAGAYGIQDEGDPFVTVVEGGFSNVVGLPVDLVLDMLAGFGVRPPPR